MKHKINLMYATVSTGRGSKSRFYRALVDKYSGNRYKVVSCPQCPELVGAEKVYGHSLFKRTHYKSLAKVVAIDYIATKSLPTEQSLIDAVDTYKFITDDLSEAKTWGEPIYILSDADGNAVQAGFLYHDIVIVEDEIVDAE